MTGTVPAPREEFFTGLVGRVVETFGPHTEASPAAIGAQFLIGFGCALGTGPRFHVGETKHHLNEFLAVVGRSARARKGDAKNAALRPLVTASPDFAECVQGGLSSGEGLIYWVRDPAEKQMSRGSSRGAMTLADSGVSDKRLLLVETEFSGVLKQFRRDGNILSNTLRDCWDAKPVLATLTKNSSVRATNAHVSLIAHTTPADLAEYLADVEVANGLGNRFLFILVDRDRVLPFPGRALPSETKRLADEVRQALDLGRKAGDMRLTAEAESLWTKLYPNLTDERPGLLGSLLARAEAHVRRLAALYALSAHMQEIGVPHVNAALAFWDYVVESTEAIFSERTGNRSADRIRSDMLPGQAMTLTEIRASLFSNHISAGRLQAAISLLREMGAVGVEAMETGGRPQVVVTRLDEPGTRREAQECRAGRQPSNSIPRVPRRKAQQAQKAPLIEVAP